MWLTTPKTDGVANSRGGGTVKRGEGMLDAKARAYALGSKKNIEKRRYSEDKISRPSRT